MTKNIRRTIKIIIATIWVVGAVMYGIKGNYLFSGLFAGIGILFLLKGLKNEKR